MSRRKRKTVHADPAGPVSGETYELIIVDETEPERATMARELEGTVQIFGLQRAGSAWVATEYTVPRSALEPYETKRHAPNVRAVALARIEQALEKVGM